MRRKHNIEIWEIEEVVYDDPNAFSLKYGDCHMNPSNSRDGKKETSTSNSLPKKLIQLRLDPKDVRIIDGESKRSGIDRAQFVRSWVKEKIREMENSANS